MAVLSEKLREIGRPMAPNILSSIEKNHRRVDVDDLVALASALDISPSALLMPQMTVSPLMDPDDMPALKDSAVETSAGPDVAAGALWNWLTGRTPLTPPTVNGTLDRFALTLWKREQTPRFAWESAR